MLIVTHDPDEAMRVADHLILMSGGHILQTGRPEHCYRHPVSVAAARLLGEAIILSASIASGVAQTSFGSLPTQGMPDGPAELILRPETFQLTPDGTPADVSSVQFVGNGYRIGLVTAHERIALYHRSKPPSQGEKARVSIRPNPDGVQQ